jgi:gas vesicle protein
MKEGKFSCGAPTVWQADAGMTKEFRMSHSENSSGNVFLAFIVGALAGTVATLLYAPASGSEVRERISDAARMARKRGMKLARAGQKFVDDSREEVASAVEQGTTAFREARGDKA